MFALMYIVSIYNSTLYSSSTLLPAASTRFASVVSLSAFCQNLDRRLVQLLLRTQCSLRPLLYRLALAVQCRPGAVTRLQTTKTWFLQNGSRKQPEFGRLCRALFALCWKLGLFKHQRKSSAPI